MTPDLEPAPDARLFILDDAGLVYAHEAQEIYALNAAATFIWCRMEMGDGAADICKAFEATFKISNGEAERYVDDVVAQWRTLGLLNGAERSTRPPTDRRREAEPVPPDLPPYVAPSVARQRSYRLLTTTVTVRYGDPAQDEWVHPILAHLETADGATGATGATDDTVIDVLADGGAHFIYRDGAAAARCDGVDSLGPQVKGLVWQAAVNGYDYLLNIHAGVVSDGETCFLLPGAQGSGKTTLTATLVHSGFEYFSDEVALLEAESFHVRPVPLCFCVKSTGWDGFAGLFPDIDTRPTHHRMDGKLVRYLPPPAAALPASLNVQRPVSAVIFPRYSPDAETALQPVRKVEALHRLMDECVAMPADLTPETVARMVEWMRGIDCYELPMSSLDAAIEAVRTLRTDRR